MYYCSGLLQTLGTWLIRMDDYCVLDLHLLSNKPYVQKKQFLKLAIVSSVKHFTNFIILFGTTFFSKKNNNNFNALSFEPHVLVTTFCRNPLELIQARWIYIGMFHVESSVKSHVLYIWSNDFFKNLPPFFLASCLSLGCYKKTPQIGCIKQQTFISLNFESWEVQN